MRRTAAGSNTSYRYEWALFTDWCAAADTTPLPASPMTLAEFLADNPAGDRAQIRRISAINLAHLDSGHPPPGRTTALRVALDSSRAERRHHRARQLATAAAALPTAGSTEALFGRRDTVLLMLAGAGLSYRAIAALDRADIEVDEDASLWIGGDHRLRLTADDPAGCRPAEAWGRWETVLRFADRYPSTTLVLDHLRGNTFPDISGWPERACPVAVPIDRWGHMPFPADAMSPAAIADVVEAHRTGIAPLRSPVRQRPIERTDDTHDAAPVVPEHDSAILDTDYYQAGIRARRTAHTLLTEVPGLYDDVEDRIDALLARTLDLLEQHTDETDQPL
ncbi:hypothetical protein [Rhodococcus sp. H29-C3]|uniref:hypothetical protein n=1 Tax=Rhodococcus sp. H29-C3 TaxID=3046307 RepID=UPI0024BA8D90|nr:hypothetical protein [Rhodococcus sp. H29-C3]MDJ0362330.1 hypothetical protein [Rhodococcus sp. H29-C3]